MKTMVHVIRVLVAGLFIFSGFVKAIDPLGTSYKMHEYFEAFSSLGLPSLWQGMSAWSTPIAVFMIVLEMAAGLALLIGWMPALTVWILFLMTLFFTILTGFTYLSGYCPTLAFGIVALLITALWITSAARFHQPDGKIFFRTAILSTLIMLAATTFTNVLLSCPFTPSLMKVTDCGCFGDFIKLKPWETFWKDIFLDILIFILVVRVRDIHPLFPAAGLHFTTALFTGLSLLFCFSNFLWGLPIIDFRPYKIGNNIRELRQPIRPEVRDYVFVYKNVQSGEERHFRLEELDQINESWTFVDRRDIIIDPGIPAPINNLFIRNADGDDITDELLSDKNYSFMVVIDQLGKTRGKAFPRLNEIAEWCDRHGLHFYAVYGGDVPAEPFRHEMQTPFEFFTADETALKTIIRSNPGLVLLKDGKVIDMWHHRHLPSPAELEEKLLNE
jgi:uncharacterized membrane protein YphA (DoxX/SURF4 family)